MKSLSDKEVKGSDLVGSIIASYRTAQPFVEYLNVAVS
jgi:hypothetical protein